MNAQQLPNIETVSSEVHQAWIEAKLAQGITSRPAATGEEQMVPYDQLTEPLKELDRSTVRAVFAAIERCASIASTHTPDEDFEHFLIYSGMRAEPPEIIAKLRQAFDAAG